MDRLGAYRLTDSFICNLPFGINECNENSYFMFKQMETCHLLKVKQYLDISSITPNDLKG